jgi:hypothetical protein
MGGFRLGADGTRVRARHPPQFDYVAPHAADWRQAKTYRAGMDFNRLSSR